MDKILVVLPCNIYVAPFLSVYINILKETNSNFKLIYWDRDGILEENGENIFAYSKKITSNDGNKFKILSFLGFSRYVKINIKKNNYDKLIFLSTYSWTVVLLSFFLKRNYSKKYWIDIRDHTFENLAVYKLLLKKAIKNSYSTSISSEGFESFLPKSNYLKLHNIDQDAISRCIPSTKSHMKYPIRISFIGNVRYYDENIKLIVSLANDNRFLLQYYGSGSIKLKKYCDENKITNVDFIGRFDREKTAELYAKTDIINNLYGNKTTELVTALSNKLYFSLSLNIPIIVSSGTLMANIVNKIGVGLVIKEADESLADKIISFYKEYVESSSRHETLNQELFSKYKDENRYTLDELKKFINS